MISRRDWLAAAGALAAPIEGAVKLPLRGEFPVVGFETCLNNARWHPLSHGSMKAVTKYLEHKAGMLGEDMPYSARQQALAKASFARLIGATAEEISFVPSTSAGENFVVRALGLPGKGGNVVTDALHFEGSLYMYGELAKQGLEVRIVKPKAWGIRTEDIDGLIDKNTRLVAISQVSMTNGFVHDVKAVCDAAHAKGALVFVDAVQAAGAMPMDVKASGADFLSSASYKWLMGDMGLGFLYARKDRWDRLRRFNFGYRQLAVMDYHLFPYDPPGDQVFEWKPKADAGSLFEIGTISATTVAALSYSLPLIEQIGTANIEAYRRPMMERLQKEMPRFGFEPLTPAGSRGPIVSFAVKDSATVEAKLKRAKVNVSVNPGRVRISPSLYNDMADLDRLFEALS